MSFTFGCPILPDELDPIRVDAIHVVELIPVDGLDDEVDSMIARAIGHHPDARGETRLGRLERVAIGDRATHTPDVDPASSEHRCQVDEAAEDLDRALANA